MGKARRSKEDNVIYSVWIRHGPDTIHYDIVFEEDCIRFIYLGEYWQRIRPRTGLQQRVDLFIYSLRKRRERNMREARHGFTIDYCSIKSYSLVRPRTASPQSNVTPGVLELTLRDGRRVRIEFSPKVYEVVKSAVKRYVVRGIERCRDGS